MAASLSEERNHKMSRSDMANEVPLSSLEFVLPRLGPPVTENVYVEEQTFVLQKPSQSDAPIAGLEGYTPFWADLWPAARMLAKAILRESWTPGTEALELGCGLGLPGIVALSRGLKVTFSDFDACALHFAAGNAKLNGFKDFQTRQLDWRNPPADLQYPILFGSDLIYEQSKIEPLVQFLKQALAPGGVCLLTDQEHIPPHAFQGALDEAKLRFTTQLVRSGEPGGRRLKGTLYHIGHA
jgi:predicted nicotinamide N-methyase